ncbi:GAF domain-containing protein [Sphingomonas sp.]|uniref:GAF domain-containing protein n=1 Tax=Sphingomonas sp. TaxID=28214 RepID=UPI001AFF162F|nr:GAF domain-containing protein [Sphingomonas sp.]MBO9712847.1 GAF domain-containing protein [Sphingomonas sp.]
MSTEQVFERRRMLITAMTSLVGAESFDELVEVLRRHARFIAASEGVCVVRREGDQVAYLAEDAVRPLWAGRRFPIEACISGRAIVEKRAIQIPDIYADERVPHAAYRPTFVGSMAMFPIGLDEPSMALGAYWRAIKPIEPVAVTLLSSLADCAGHTLQRLTSSAAAA